MLLCSISGAIWREEVLNYSLFSRTAAERPEIDRITPLYHHNQAWHEWHNALHGTIWRAVSGGQDRDANTKTSHASLAASPSHTPLSLRIPITLQNKQEAIVIKNKDQVCSSNSQRALSLSIPLHTSPKLHAPQTYGFYIIQSECSRIPRLIWKPKWDQAKWITAANLLPNYLRDREMFSHLAFKSSRYFAAFLHTPATLLFRLCSRVMTWYKCGGKTSTGWKGRTRKKTQCSLWS